MKIELYPHQLIACADIDGLFRKNKIVLCVLATGAGKTLVKAEYARRCVEQNKTCHVLAHKDVLLSQISDALCMMGVRHNFICSAKNQRDTTNANLLKFGDSFYDENAKITVVSVTTLRARLKGKCEFKSQQHYKLCASVDFWMIDECHHLTKGSSWGIAVEAYHNAYGLGVTATPIRGDLKGLGAHVDGYFTAMSDTTSMWELIQAGRLTPYKIYQPNEHIDLSDVKVTNGEYNQKQTSSAVNTRKITGSAVAHYKRVLNNQPVITFGVDIEHCEAIARQFNEAGVPSMAVSSNTPLSERNKAVDDLRAGRLMNLVNCGLYGEGFDAPAVMGVIMLRPTQSYSLYKQQFGRMLRKSEGKTHGILLDHVGNTLFMMAKYGLTYPHDDPQWTLDRGSKGKKSDDGEVLAETITCGECELFYLAKDHDSCPDCGHVITESEKEAKAREIQEVSGELVELSVEAVNALIQERVNVDTPIEQFSNKVQGLTNVARYGAMNRHAKRQHAQTVLRDRIQRWCSYTAENTNWDKDTVQREFNRLFGVKIMKAVVLSEREANELCEKIPYYL